MTPIFLSIPVLSIPRSTDRDWPHTVDTRSVSVPIRDWLRTAPRDITSCLSVVQNMRANPNSAWPYRVVALTLAVKAARRAVHAGIPDACEWPYAAMLIWYADSARVVSTQAAYPDFRRFHRCSITAEPSHYAPLALRCAHESADMAARIAALCACGSHFDTYINAHYTYASACLSWAAHAAAAAEYEFYTTTPPHSSYSNPTPSIGLQATPEARRAFIVERDAQLSDFYAILDWLER